MIKGNVAMCYGGPWVINGYLSGNPDIEYRSVEPPKGLVRKASYSGGSNLVILNQTKSKRASKAWINFLIEEKKLIDYTKNLSKMLPAKIKAFDDPYYQSYDFQVYKDTLEYATPYPSSGVWGSVETVIVDGLKDILKEYSEGKYTEESVKKHLDIAVEKLGRCLCEEK